MGGGGAKSKSRGKDPYVFAEVIWRELYMMNSNVPLELLLLWSQYIFSQVELLRKVSDFEFLNGYWSFSVLPDGTDRERLRRDIAASWTHKLHMHSRQAQG